jgi:hypothetical protein
MTVFALARCELLEHGVQVFNCSCLKLDRRHARGRSDGEHRDDARPNAAARYCIADLPGDVPDISLSVRGNLKLLRRDHRSRISRSA